jgi:F-type H+-transporting ATPase subunit delta
MASLLQSASREALAAATARLDEHIDATGAADLERLADDLFAVVGLLNREHALRRALADPATPSGARGALADRLFDGKIGRPALDVVSDVVKSRWSRPVDLLDGLESLARAAAFGVAEKDGASRWPWSRGDTGSLDRVEDELFRFGRILDREPELSRLLSDTATPVDKRVGLLRDLLGEKVTPVTATLLEQAVRNPRSRNLDVVAEELSELAAARRDRYVAHVRTPVRMTAEQEQRLTDSLGRLYGRPMSLQVELDESLLGGLVVRVGGEVIDGSVAGRLGAARRQLPH